MTKPGNEVEVRVSVARRHDGLYTAIMEKPGSSAKLTGCTWEEAQKLLAEAGPKFNFTEALALYSKHTREIMDQVIFGVSAATLEDAARSVHSATCPGDGPAQDCQCQKSISATKTL